MPEEWNRCPEHGAVCTHYCVVCRELVCEGCTKHQAHEVYEISQYVNECRYEIPTIQGIHDLEPQIDKAIRDINLYGIGGLGLDSDLGIVSEDGEAAGYEMHDAASDPAFSKAIQLARLQKAKEIIKKDVLSDEEKLLLLMLRDKGALNLMPSRPITGSRPSKIASRPNYNFDSDVERYKAFPDVRKTLPIEEALQEELVDVGDGVMISRPVECDIGLITTGSDYHITISPRAVVALCWRAGGVEDESSPDYLSVRMGDFKAQITDILGKRQVVFDTESATSIVFFDEDLITLTYNCPLRGCTVEEIFAHPDVSIMKHLSSQPVSPLTAAPTLHHSRHLYYKTLDNVLRIYDVDRKKSSKVKMGVKVWSIPSLCGMKMNNKCVFSVSSSTELCVLDWDDSVVSHSGLTNDNWVTHVLLSQSEPECFEKAVLKCHEALIRNGKKLKNDLHLLDCDHSIVRVYKDVFLLHDHNTRTWVLSRILVP